ncbi:bifunctional diaminohydroxyphosphoribosylaminopyrimidine deaminase/5-amino-6-(5-phosphoribosylamino)uracil reductase RibD [Tropicimonas sp. IMCC34011]|uniref:bifunctional diaminohydroxyphosphoribosylaminopyrimidine deaminase/5-amino-6-(5-phosphoribosylamino)uracil reductase RibD n=1 Tax=Tropicimonas sp. IMCC34011 TaxID=2248759 RepID=UPI000E230A6E
MRAALGLAARGLGRVWPNPAVGCIIVRDGRVVGRGRTQDGGRPHAEVVALTEAGRAAEGADVYVTLEPCAHHGKTPPCSDALVAARPARVITALTDPDPRTAGQGHARLRAAGIKVVTGVLAAEADRLQEGFLRRVTSGRPMLTLKLAGSVDGRIATASGESRWITGPAARRLVHGMRARHDAVLIGSGTARADDPMLTVRGLGVDRQPVRVVASRRLDLDPKGRLAASARDVPLWLCHGPDAPAKRIAEWREQGAVLLECPLAGSQLDMDGMMAALGAGGLTRVFCEGGGQLAASLLGAGLVDELIAFTGGVALGAEGWPGLAAMGIGALGEAPRFRLDRLEEIGGDAVAYWRPHREIP